MNETKVELVWITPNAEALIAEMARVSNPTNAKNPSYAGLIKYLIREKHHSPFEMANMCLSIQTSRRIAPQILRHRSFSFQEFCITGDSLITTVQPNGQVRYISIEKLYEKQNFKNYTNIRLRVFDEGSKEFTTSKIKEVFFNGIKPVFKIITSDNKEITCTKEHKFYTKNGFDTLENIVGLELTKTNRATMNKKGLIGVNGVPVHQNQEWLAQKINISPKLSLQEIALDANVTTHTIRKWLKKYNLQYTKKEMASYTTIWNKGKFGYKNNLIHSLEHIQAIKLARSGPKSNWWKGGVDRSERLKIADWCNSIRHKKLELDHIIPVYQDTSLAYSYENIQVLCHECHTNKHRNNGDYLNYRMFGKGNKLAPKWVEIKSIEYVGLKPTYDLEVEHSSHNYIANKIMVHNSQRYAKVEGFMNVNPRRQDEKNRQSSHDDLSPENKEWFQYNIKNLQENAYQFYEAGLARGISKESMAFVLPPTAQTHLYMNGNFRSWMHYTDLRSANGTQLEHREIALQVKDLMIKHLPHLSEAMGWINNAQ